MMMEDDKKGDLKTKSDDLCINLKKLLSAENLCKWKPVYEEENKNEVDREQFSPDTFSFLNFTMDILTSYFEYEAGNITNALNAIEEVEMSLNDLRNENQNNFFSQISEAVYHVTLTQKALILMRCNEQECIKVFENVVSINNMNACNNAAIFAIRSACEAMYSFEGTRTAVSHINIAIKIDPGTPYWKFLKGTYVKKLRQLQNPNSVPLLEEGKLFAEVVEKEKDNPVFMVHLAENLKDVAFTKIKNKEKYFALLEKNKSIQNEVNTEIEGLFKRSWELYEKSYEMKPKCPLIAFPCAYGLMTLTQKYQNVKKAKNILKEMIPKHKTSGYGNLINAFYFEVFGKNNNLAKQYLQACMSLNIFNGFINMIRLRFEEEEETEFNAVEELIKLLDRFKETPKQKLVLSQIISYYIFVDLNLQKACEYTIKFYEIPGEQNCLEYHRSCFFKTAEPFSLIDIVTDEVNYTLGDRNLTPQMRSFFNKFVHIMNFSNIVVIKNIPQNLRKQILEGKNPNTDPWYSKQINKYQKKIPVKRGKPNQNNFKQSQKYDPRRPVYTSSVAARSQYELSKKPQHRATASPFKDTIYTQSAAKSSHSHLVGRSAEIPPKMKQFFETFKTKPPSNATAPLHPVVATESQRSSHNRKIHRSQSSNSDYDRRSKQHHDRRRSPTFDSEYDRRRRRDRRRHKQRDSFDDSEDEHRYRSKKSKHDLHRRRRSTSTSSSSSSSDSYSGRNKRGCSRDRRRHYKRSNSEFDSFSSEADHASRRRTRRSHSDERYRKHRGKHGRKSSRRYRHSSLSSVDSNDYDSAVMKLSSRSRQREKQSSHKDSIERVTREGKSKRDRDESSLTRKLRSLKLDSRCNPASLTRKLRSLKLDSRCNPAGLTRKLRSLKLDNGCSPDDSSNDTHSNNGHKHKSTKSSMYETKKNDLSCDEKNFSPRKSKREHESDTTERQYKHLGSSRLNENKSSYKKEKLDYSDSDGCESITRMNKHNGDVPSMSKNKVRRKESGKKSSRRNEEGNHSEFDEHDSNSNFRRRGKHGSASPDVQSKPTTKSTTRNKMETQETKSGSRREKVDHSNSEDDEFDYRFNRRDKDHSSASDNEGRNRAKSNKPNYVKERKYEKSSNEPKEKLNVSDYETASRKHKQSKDESPSLNTESKLSRSRKVKSNEKPEEKDSREDKRERLSMSIVETQSSESN